MADKTRMKPGKLFSAVAWGAMAVTIASLIVPSAAEAAARPGNERSERGEGRASGNRGEQFRGRSNERASPNASRRDARPAAKERAPAEMRRNWSRSNDDRARTQAERSPNRGLTATRSSNDRPNDRGERERSWSRSRAEISERGAAAVRQERRNNERRSDNRNDRHEASRHDSNRDRPAWRNDSDRDRSSWRNDANRDRSQWRDRDHRGDHRDYRNARRWDRHEWRRDNRYDWKRHRDRHRSTYRIGRYYAPYYGYSYRRIGIGFSLGSVFYGSRYWITDPWYYRLPEVYGPYRWVRYYDDVLLVNIYTGEVVDVIHDFFW